MDIIFLTVNKRDVDVDNYPISRTLHIQVYTDMDTARYHAEKSEYWKIGHRWDADGDATNDVNGVYFSIDDMDDVVDKPFVREKDISEVFN